MIWIIGAGLAGCEAAYQLGKRGFDVRLFEMKPQRFSPAHQLAGPAELVCSNSLGSESIGAASALLKAELEILDSLIIRSAKACRVPAGAALAVNREAMTRTVKSELDRIDHLTWVNREVREIPEVPTLIATGPLTADDLAEKIGELAGKNLHFFDATSPIVEAASIDMSRVYAASRYDKGTPDYLNCPMNESQYQAFVQEIKNARLVMPKDFENFKVFEGCMPIEEIAARGDMTLAFGPLKPVGLPDPKTGIAPYAVVQLRKENLEGESYNLVGFQTRMTFEEQRRIFRMIPGLEKAQFVRLGVMHRNTFIQSPDVLDERLRVRAAPHVAFAGQLTGVEGYVESTASGLLCALFLAFPELPAPPPETMIGALHHYVTTYSGDDFQPMAANFGLLKPLSIRLPKKKRKVEYHERALRSLSDWIKHNSMVENAE